MAPNSILASQFLKFFLGPQPPDSSLNMHCMLIFCFAPYGRAAYPTYNCCLRPWKYQLFDHWSGRKIYPKVENSLVCNHFRGILKVFTYVMYPLTGLDYWIGMEHWTGLLEPPLYFFRKVLYSELNCVAYCHPNQYLSLTGIYWTACKASVPDYIIMMKI